jgi:hypothetical protein
LRIGAVVLLCCCREQQLWERQQALLERMQQQWDQERQVRPKKNFSKQNGPSPGHSVVTAVAGLNGGKHTAAVM